MILLSKALYELKNSLSPSPTLFGGRWREVEFVGSHLSQQPMAVLPVSLGHYLCCPLPMLVALWMYWM